MSFSGLTHYQVLGLTKDASPDEIKRAYRVQAMRHHPDRQNGDSSLFVIVKHAFDTLSDYNLRKEYDAQLSHELILDATVLVRTFWRSAIND